jgi:hypothetical protein
MANELEIYNGENEENVPPLNESEEQAYEQAKNEKAEDELLRLFDRVKNVKSAIENPEFQDIFIQPIRGNIESIKTKLETEEKHVMWPCFRENFLHIKKC